MIKVEKTKVLWISNVPPIEIKENPRSVMGGWLSGAYNNINKDESIELSLAFPVSRKLHGLRGEIEGTKYYGFSLPKWLKYFGLRKLNGFLLKKYLEVIIKEVEPDVFHVFGTELQHSKTSVECFGKPDKTIIHIQGMVSVYANHCKMGFPFFIKHLFVPISFLSGTIYRQARKWKKAGKDEITAIEQVQYIMGRTEWDEACVKAINPSVTYVHCGETLRSAFYDVQWKQDQCVKHTIYFSQSSSQVKGLHQVLPVLPQLIKQYPDLHLYIGGNSPIGDSSFKSFLKRSPLGWYLKSLIKKYKLQDFVTFMGSQSEKQVVQNLLNANVFLSASLIENSPNSVGEAMVIGTPVVSSDVGGVKDFIQHGKNGYIYPVDEPYMIPYYISKIFEDQELANSFSDNSRESGRIAYSQTENSEVLLATYRTIGTRYNCNRSVF